METLITEEDQDMIDLKFFLSNEELHHQVYQFIFHLKLDNVAT